MNGTATPPPAITDGDVAVSYVLIPFLLITVVGVVAAVGSGGLGLIQQIFLRILRPFSCLKFSCGRLVTSNIQGSQVCDDDTQIPHSKLIYGNYILTLLIILVKFVGFCIQEHMEHSVE